MNRFKYLTLTTLLYAGNTLVAMEALRIKQQAVAKAEASMPTTAQYPADVQELINEFVKVRADRMEHIFFHPEAISRFEWTKTYNQKNPVKETSTENYWIEQIETALASYNKTNKLSLKMPSNEDITALAKQKISNDIVRKTISAPSTIATLQKIVRDTEEIIEEIEIARKKTQKNPEASRLADSYYEIAKPAYQEALAKYQAEYQNRQAIEAEKSAQKKKTVEELMAKGYPPHIQQLINALVDWRVTMMNIAFEAPQREPRWTQMLQGDPYELGFGDKSELDRRTEISNAIAKYNHDNGTSFGFPSDDELNKLAKPIILKRYAALAADIESRKEKNPLLKNNVNTPKTSFARFYYETLKEGIKN